MFTRKSWAPLLAVALVALSFAACDRNCDTCAPTGATPVPTPTPRVRPDIRLGGDQVSCPTGTLVVIGTGFTPGRQVIIRVKRTEQDYNDFPSSRENQLFADSTGVWTYRLPYDRFWDTGRFTVLAFDVATGTWTASQLFDVLNCPRPQPTPTPGPTPGPPGPTPPPTGPTPPPGCTANPSMTVSPKSGQRGSTFTLQAVGFCPNDRVNWVVSGIGVGSATVGSDGTTRWTHRSEPSDSLGTKTASVTNQNGRSASDTFTITN